MANKYKNIVLEEKGDRLSYKPVNPRGSESKYPPRDSRVNHAIKIRREFENAWAHATKESNERLAVATQAREGVYLEIKGQVGYDLVTKSLEDQRQGVKLLNVTQDENGVTKAAVFVPNQKREFFIKKINTYQESIKGTEVVGTIESINEAIVDTFWVSTKDSIPAENREWCEVWLAYKQNTADAKMVFEKFSSYCQTQNIPIKSQKIVFPEKIVVGIEANKNDLSAILLSCSNVSEFRKMSAATSFFTSLQTSEQREWIENSEQSNTSICLLDTGVNNAHPLLSELLSDHDMHTIHPEKGVNDTADHGTKMAGLAAYFTLEDKLEGTEPIKIHHFLESVKLLDNPNDNERELYGYCAYKAISLAEIERPYSNRTICIAITTDDSFVKDGRPSSWSGAIDSLTSGANENDIKRLILISAGNTTIEEIREAGDYRVAVTNHSIEDPGQAWNAITVGAYTEKTLVSDETCKGYEPVAKHGGYSPFTSSSLTWDKKWPIKPEIVLEGGNLAYNKSDDFYSEVDNLALLTTGNKFLGKKFFDVFSMTSAATAQAAWIAANIRHNYPDLWPETIRALMIHSASWTKAMLQEVLRGDQKAKKSEYRQLLQTCGYGVPNLE
ncbi:MAG: S8 family peptidase, partial [Oscillospiraceae bacterium]